jgi:phosphatidylinositol 4-kinase
MLSFPPNFLSQTDDLIEQLASLLLPIDALLANNDFNPQMDASPGIVTLFRHMWFLCILFQFTCSEQEDTAMEWQKPALARIAAKTPSMILEEAHDSIASDLEYNSVVRQEYAHTVSILLCTLSTINLCQGYRETSVYLDETHLFTH